jgi:hypothetical protein
VGNQCYLLKISQKTIVQIKSKRKQIHRLRTRRCFTVEQAMSCPYGRAVSWTFGIGHFFSTSVSLHGVLKHRPKCAIPNKHANTIVLRNTDGFPKLIYSASWSTGAPAKELFGLCAKSANARVLSFTYSVVIHNGCAWSFGNRETVETMKRKRPQDQRACFVP